MMKVIYPTDAKKVSIYHSTVRWETFEGENFHELQGLRVYYVYKIFFTKFGVCHSHKHFHLEILIFYRSTKVLP